MELELIPCPGCDLPAEVLDRTSLASTDGPLEHVRTQCVAGHFFLMPAGFALEHPLGPRRFSDHPASRAG